MKTVLMVAEKPSLAKTIAEILSNRQCREIKLTGKSLYVWNGYFQNENVVFKMSSVFGHVYCIDFDQEANHKHLDPACLFRATIIRKDAMAKMRVPAFLRSLAENEGRGLDYLVLWLDCDKEGENICFEVLDIVKRFFNDKSVKIIYSNFRGAFDSNHQTNFNRNNSGTYYNSNASYGSKRLVFRAKFSSLSPPEILNAFANLIEPNYLESRSVDARQELDLRIGCAFTRAQTKHIARILPLQQNSQEKMVVSFGPCQTPTLGFCVARQDYIQNFNAQPYWMLSATVSSGGQNPMTYRKTTDNNPTSLNVNWERGRIFDHETIKAFHQAITHSSIYNGISMAKVKSIRSNLKQLNPPLPLNTVQLLRIASSAFGFSPHHTMEIAERLYTSGYVSYPRTETTAYNATFDFTSILQAGSRAFQQTSHNANNATEYIVMANCIQRLLGPNGQFSWSQSNLRSSGTAGKDVGDHPPITPTPQILSSAEGARNRISADGYTLYNYIYTHFLATLMPPAQYLEHVTTFDIGGEIFSAQHKELCDPGYMVLMPWKLSENGLSSSKSNNPHNNNSSETMFKEGQLYPVTKMIITDGSTKPPNLLTESELIKLMEAHGIGTDASIPVHIKKILDRNYVKIVGAAVNKKVRGNQADPDYEIGLVDGSTQNATSNKSRYLLPTPLGIALVRSYETIDIELVLPTMRAAMERELNHIASGQVMFEVMVQHAITIYSAKYHFFASHMDLICQNFMSLANSNSINSVVANSKSNSNSFQSQDNRSLMNRSGSFRGRGGGGTFGKRGNRGRGGTRNRGMTTSRNSSSNFSKPAPKNNSLANAIFPAYNSAASRHSFNNNSNDYNTGNNLFNGSTTDTSYYNLDRFQRLT